MYTKNATNNHQRKYPIYFTIEENVESEIKEIVSIGERDNYDYFIQLVKLEQTKEGTFVNQGIVYCLCMKYDFLNVVTDANYHDIVPMNILEIDKSLKN